MEIKRLAMLVIAVAVLVGCTPTPDPKSVVEQLGEAEAARDIDAAVALFADEAVIITGNDSEFSGIEEVRAFFQNAYVFPGEIQYHDIQAEGNRVTWILRDVFGDRVSEILIEATVEDGKITLLHEIEVIME